MAITYNNPDEIAKVKHILSLAEHIAEKIDGSGSGSGSSSSSSSTSKQTPTLSASTTTLSAATFTENSDGEKVAPSNINLTYSGDGQLLLESDAILTKNLRFRVIKNGADIAVKPLYSPTFAPTFPVTFSVGFTETENYKACSVDITITA